MIQAGDYVYHKPTKEEWYILGVNQEKNKVCVAGWPLTIAYLSDCVLIEKGNGITQEELEYRRKQFGDNWS